MSTEWRVGMQVRVGGRHAAPFFYERIVGRILPIHSINHPDALLKIKVRASNGYTINIHEEDALPFASTNADAARHLLSKTY